MERSVVVLPHGAEAMRCNEDGSAPKLLDKEKDAETGLSNFGVRNYDDGLGRFMSVDVLWEKYRSLTPYQYSANNPLILKDPGGEVIQFAEGTSEEFKKEYQEAIDYLRQSETASEIINYLENSDQVFTIQEGEIGDSRYSNGVIFWNSRDGLTVLDNNEEPVEAYDKNGRPVRPAQSPAIGLIHEMGHGYHDDTERGEMLNRMDKPVKHYRDAEEEKTIETIENKVIKEINAKAKRKQEVERHNHYSKSYKTKSSTTTTPED